MAQRLLDTTEGPIVLVDNASGDDSVARMRRLQSHAQQRLTVVPLRTNLGAVARNIGVAHCDTEYVAFCDDDSWWDPKSIAAAESIFDLHPGVALLAARTIVLPGGYDDPLTYALAHSPLGRWPNLPGPSVLGFLACASIIRRSAFTAVGGFSPILHFRGEEQLMAWDLASKGWHLCYCDELVTYHQPSKLRPPGDQQRARRCATTRYPSGYADRIANVCARARSWFGLRCGSPPIAGHCGRQCRHCPRWRPNVAGCQTKSKEP